MLEHLGLVVDGGKARKLRDERLNLPNRRVRNTDDLLAKVGEGEGVPVAAVVHGLIVDHHVEVTSLSLWLAPSLFPLLHDPGQPIWLLQCVLVERLRIVWQMVTMHQGDLIFVLEERVANRGVFDEPIGDELPIPQDLRKKSDYLQLIREQVGVGVVIDLPGIFQHVVHSVVSHRRSALGKYFELLP